LEPNCVVKGEAETTGAEKAEKLVKAEFPCELLMLTVALTVELLILLAVPLNSPVSQLVTKLVAQLNVFVWASVCCMLSTKKVHRV
jgi:hypothetical protein